VAARGPFTTAPAPEVLPSGSRVPTDHLCSTDGRARRTASGLLHRAALGTTLRRLAEGVDQHLSITRVERWRRDDTTQTPPLCAESGPPRPCCSVYGDDEGPPLSGVIRQRRGEST